MRRDTLADVFADLASIRGEFLVHDNGYRVESRTYADVARAARAFAARLSRQGLRKGDRVLLWGENCPEWVVALWGAILAGVVAVPIDYRSSLDFVRRILRSVDARLIVAGREVALPDNAAAGESGETLDGAAVWHMSEFDWRDTREAPLVELRAEDTAEIIFTSGATADPRGVVLTHRNILASVLPVEREVVKYRSYARPFSPLRFLNLLPLSHMFGQVLATLIPPMLAGTTIFMRSVNPHDIVNQIRRRRVSVLVSVPKILDVLREHMRRVVPSAAEPASIHLYWTRRWWKHRDVHRLFGPKFWCCTVGAAPLDPDLEQFWSQLGFLVVQGYGLTETAPIVALNHPFAAHRGSVGKPLEGLDVRIAPDGEILVRGNNVTAGYFNAPDATAAAFEDGWLRTGDIGELDAEGRLYVRGRKKELIVRADGLNVFPDDVERAVNAVPGVIESAVVGLGSAADQRVHAVLVLEAGVSPDQVVAEANSHLADHQRIRTASIWPDARLPRTEGTRKLKRVEIRQRSQGDQPASGSSAADESLESLVARFAPGRAITSSTTLDELGLTSLDRVELMVAIEQRFGAAIDESAFSATRNLGDLRQMVERAPQAEEEVRGGIPFPSWNRSLLARVARRLMLDGLVIPFTRIVAKIDVDGVERLPHDGAVVFAANHLSHMDTPVVLAALPRRWRARLAPAMAKEFFSAHFFPAQATRRERWRNGLLYYLAALFFNAFPLPQREAGARDTLRYIGNLASDGYSVLIFPEGERSVTGSILPFRPGVGMIASRLDLPVVPIRLDGVDRVMPTGSIRMRRGAVRVRFGRAVLLHGDRYADLAKAIENAVKSL